MGRADTEKGETASAYRMLAYWVAESFILLDLLFVCHLRPGVAVPPGMLSACKAFGIIRFKF